MTKKRRKQRKEEHRNKRIDQEELGTTHLNT
jgi:hypothetical protein